VNIQVAEVVEMLSPAVEIGNLLVLVVNYLSEKENPFVEVVNFLIGEESLVAVEVKNLAAAVLNWVEVGNLAAAVLNWVEEENQVAVVLI